LVFKRCKDVPGETCKTAAARKREDTHPPELRATLARSRAIIRVSLERREHHGPRDVTVVGRTLSESSILFGFYRPAMAKAPARTPCPTLSQKKHERNLTFAQDRTFLGSKDPTRS
jgi:hypothetical protein